MAPVGPGAGHCSPREEAILWGQLSLGPHTYTHQGPRSLGWGGGHPCSCPQAELTPRPGAQWGQRKGTGKKPHLALFLSPPSLPSSSSSSLSHSPLISDGKHKRKMSQGPGLGSPSPQA